MLDIDKQPIVCIDIMKYIWRVITELIDLINMCPTSRGRTKSPGKKMNKSACREKTLCCSFHHTHLQSLKPEKKAKHCK